ncbi:hypothetical protein H4684_000799 [Desulfomicrobium macestii]|uniref:Uncharacterized protein n=1 Tax=Desulfomicrobium macestii TaxID=90731 RepID=A0ABR9H0U0_9BACT|nr:hypothetical protein [Desulfomicrobium macestii]
MLFSLFFLNMFFCLFGPEFLQEFAVLGFCHQFEPTGFGQLLQFDKFCLCLCFVKFQTFSPARPEPQLRLGHLFDRAEFDKAGFQVFVQGIDTQFLFRDLLSGKAQGQFCLVFELPAVFQDFFKFEQKGACHVGMSAKSVHKKARPYRPGFVKLMAAGC